MAEETREQRESKWWSDWFAANYSWGGLAQKPIRGGGQFGEKTLQDYWRRDPLTGISRDDTALKRAGELIELEGRSWHLAHFPAQSPEGVSTWKAHPAAPEWVQLNALLAARLSVARETFGAFERGKSWNWSPQGCDGRARWDGAVLGPSPITPKNGPKLVSLSCRNAAFLGYGHFEETTFGPGADFTSALLCGDAFFSGASFSGDASFDYVLFSRKVHFPHAEFFGKVSFLRTTFFGHANFLGVAFFIDGDFVSAKFSSNVEFDSAKFSDQAEFDGVEFLGEANFSSVKFLAEAQFNNANFFGETSFVKSTFSGKAEFHKVEFMKGVSFGAVGFQDEVNFDGAVFSDAARFLRANFSGTASFDDVTFKSSVLFFGQFKAKTRFHNAVFEGPVTFSAAIAAPERDFSGAFYAARFAGIADFSGAVGEGRGGRMAAAFAEAQFERALILTDGLGGSGGTGFHRALLKNTTDGAEGKARNDRLATLESGCRVVKIAMGKARDEVREQAYYRLQLRARQQRSDIDGWEKAAGWLYGISSDFGSSLWRPVLGLGLLVLVFAVVIYWPWMAWLNIKDVHGMGGLFVALNHSLRTLSPFNLLATPGLVASMGAPASLFEVNPAVTFGIRMVSGLQSILSTLLIFLFGLAVKRRFQIS